MLDGRGRAVITDFGLAGLADQIRGADVRSGTPAYMSPEQLSGSEVTARSDLYALGLVFYEIFTGKPAFESAPARAPSSRPPSVPSTGLKDLDPAIERVIMRCLEPEPAARPTSALAVAAALPGGDPLAAALAAGETPSPEMVAAAGDREAVRPAMAMAALAVVIAGLLISAGVGIKLSGLVLMPQPLPPEALAVKAGEIIRALGYSERAVDQSGQWYYQTEFTDYIAAHEGPRPNWAQIFSQRPQVLAYAYRRSPVYLDPTGLQGDSLTPGVVQFDDPPAIESGMVSLIVDGQGRLTYFQAIPQELEPNPPPPAAPDWSPLFRAAAIDPAQLHPAEPQWVGLAAFDARAAWTGTWPGTNRPLRVEAAAWHAKPVFFSMIGPWTNPTRMQHEKGTRTQHAAQIVGVVVLIIVLMSGAWIASRNYAQGRSDVRAARKLLLAVFVLEMAIWIARNHYVPTLATFGHFILAVSTGLFIAAATAMLYLALDPYVRRHWPQAIVSWSRVTTGHVRDALVGRDVLWGVALGVIWSVVIAVGLLGVERVGDTPQLPSQSLLLGGRQMLGVWLVNVVHAIAAGLEFFFVMFILRALLRNKWVAAVGFIGIFATMNTLYNSHPAILAPVWVVVFLIAAYAVNRFGLITLTIAIFTADLVLNLPYTLDFSNWYATGTLAVVLSFAAIATWGFRTSLAGQKLLREDLFD